MSWKYFSYEGDKMLACSCCGKQGMDDVFMRKLDVLRGMVGQGFTVTSGYRCPDHNESVSSTGRDGPHTTGRAVDIKANSRLKMLITQAAISQGITRVGVAKSFIHIDDLTEQDDGVSNNVMWTY